MFQRTKLCTSLLVAFSGTVALTSMPAHAQNTERVEVTGSRIKRADSEGALPVTVITREQLENSGAATVAEFVRNSTFSSSGNFRPQSGSSAQSFAGMDLRGLGASRTLVLIDGRRLPKAPNVGDSVDMNSIPMAAVERIEILTDGASAVYGSDAIGGVVNIITRKDFQGVAFMVGAHDPQNGGGDRREGSAVIGLSGDKGRMIAGVSKTNRDIVFTSQRPWGQALGVSTYGNNHRARDGKIKAIPGGCTEPNFWLTASGTCSFNFNAIAADEAEVGAQSFFARGEYQVDKDWTAYLNTSVSRVTSFGRYAPSLAALTVKAGSPNDFINDGKDTTIYHRFAALGNRDTSTDSNLYDILAGFQGRVMGKFDVDFGVRRTESKYTEFGRNYVVIPIAEQYVADGTYNIFNPSQNDPDVLSAMKATISRDGIFKQTELYANATTELFKLDGGMASLMLAGEYRRENYADIYDSLSEGGVIGGSAGNSSAGSRKVAALTAEMVLPVIKGLEVGLAGRFEKYNDYGSDFAPKVSVAYKPMKGLALRASAGAGFRAPPLNILYQKTSYSADSVFDIPTCLSQGGTQAYCEENSVQVDTYYKANPELKSEQSKQFSFGATWDATPWLSVKADYWNIRISNVINQLSAGEVLDRDQGVDPRPNPAGLGVTRDPATGAIASINAGYANEGTLRTDGLDLNFQTNFGFGEMGKIRNDFTYSHVFGYRSGNSDENIIGLLGSPKARAQVATMWEKGPFEVTWNMNYIAANGTVENSNRVGAYVTHDLQFNWDTPLKGGKLTVGVVNAGNKQPSLEDYDGRNFNFYLYDSYGRTPYVRFTQKF